MYAVWSKPAGAREDERGFTLQELLTTIAILGILIAIAVIVLLALLERWRVEAAARQFAADLRLAHGLARRLHAGRLAGKRLLVHRLLRDQAARPVRGRRRRADD